MKVTQEEQNELIHSQIANLVKVNDEIWKNMFHLTKKVTMLEKALKSYEDETNTPNTISR